MLACLLPLPATQLELTDGGRIEWIGVKSVTARNSVDHFETTVWPVALGHGDGSAQFNDRGWIDPQQCVIERYECVPVGVLSAMSHAMDPCHTGLDVRRGEVCTRSRKRDKPHTVAQAC